MTTLELGRVAKAHGIRGEVSVRLHWGPGDALWSADAVLVSLPNAAPVTMRVEARRRVPGGMLLKLAGIDDRTAAEALRGAGIAVDRGSLPAPAEGEYYLADLVGARVLAPEGEVGEVIAVRVHPTVDTLVIRSSDGRELEQVLDTAFVDEVDVEQKLVRLSTTDGLI